MMQEAAHIPSQSERWIPLARACQLLGVNASTLRQWADQGQIRVFRTPGGHRRFSSDDLQAFVERTAPGASAGARQRPSVPDGVLRRIRRGLQAERVASSPWYEPLDEGARGRIFEVTSEGTIVWEYLNPVAVEQLDRAALGTEAGANVGSEDRPATERSTAVFRAHRYGPDHPALEGKDLDPAQYANLNRLYADG